MLEIVSAIIGFIAPFMGPALKMVQQSLDNKHELQMFEKRLQYAERTHEWRMAEINATADIREMTALRAPQPSYAVQLMESMKGRAPNIVIWFVFLMFAVIDWLNQTVRPVIAYISFIGYLTYKYALFVMFSEGAGMVPYEAIEATWSQQDWAVLILILSYFFGARTAKYVFGQQLGRQ